MMLPDPKHLGPLAARVGVSILVMVRQKDLGSSLLFFAVFAAMLYIATERSVVPRRRARHVRRGAVVAYQLFAHVQDRVELPGSTRGRCRRRRASSSCSRCSRSAPAGSPGPGSGSGARRRSRTRRPTSCSRPSARSSGCIGTVAICMLFLLFVGSGFRIAIQAERPFSKLFAAGLTTIIGVQTFVIIGGVIRVIPLTGVTLPFVSYGGSSLIANFVIVALLLRISDETVARRRDAARRRHRPHRGARRRRRRAGPPGASVNRAIRRVGYRGDRADPACSSRSSRTSRSSTPTTSTTTRATCARSSTSTTGPGARSSPPTGTIVAQSVPTGSGDFKYQRAVPARSACSRRSAATSRSSSASTGVEESYNDVLTGRDTSLQLSDIGGLLQREAGHRQRRAVARRRPRSRPRPTRSAAERARWSRSTLTTGAVLAMYSNPTFDPNPLAVHDTPGRAERVQRHQQRTRQAGAAARRTARSTRRARRSRSSPSRRPSTAGIATPDDPVFPESDGFPISRRPARPLRNFGGEVCGGTLDREPRRTRATRRSRQIGLELGNEFVPAMDDCGVGVVRRRSTSRRAPSGASGRARVVRHDKPVVRAGPASGRATCSRTPLEMALVAAGIANGGVIMQPHVVQEIQTPTARS